MPSDAESKLAAGEDALQAGDWLTARGCFEAVLEQSEAPEALLGLAEALWWLGHMHDSVAYRERAYVGFRRRPDPARAAEIALELCVHCRANLGNGAAATGWLARARRLVEEFELEELQGWLALIEADNTSDPREAERLAQRARQLASRFGDLDLELCALAQSGASLVRQGRTSRRAGTARRSDGRVARRRGPRPRHGGVHELQHDRPLHALCRVRARRAVGAGRGPLRRALRLSLPLPLLPQPLRRGPRRHRRLEAGRSGAPDGVQGFARRPPTLHALASATLARLRLDQGRLEEAERLVAGFEGQVTAAPVLAAIQLAQGKPAVAAATAQRGLEAIGDDRLERAAVRGLEGEPSSE